MGVIVLTVAMTLAAGPASDGSFVGPLARRLRLEETIKRSNLRRKRLEIEATREKKKEKRRMEGVEGEAELV